MTVPLRHVLSQGPVLRAMGGAALSALRQVGKPRGPTPAVPGPWHEAELAPRPGELVHDYVRNVGGDPGWYRGILPAHLFPQWSMPLAARALGALPYPLVRVMNVGSRIEQRGALPSGEPLRVKARLESIDDDGRRAIVTTRIVTGTASAPDALEAELRAYVPLASQGGGRARERATVPAEAREVTRLRVGAEAGLDFAKLTGDFNPIHWLGPYARAAGFGGCILHGFATMARAIEALNRGPLAGDPRRLRVVEARFTRPLRLPAWVGVYTTSDGGLWVGDEPGGGAYLEGRFETTEETNK